MTMDCENKTDRPVLVGIGLIARGSQYLIRQRPALPGSPMPGLWEFPGGKCEPGEKPSLATARECYEETGLEVEILRCRRITRHRYPHGLVELHYFEARLVDPHTDPAPEFGFVWTDASVLPNLRFPEANAQLLSELAQEHKGKR